MKSLLLSLVVLLSCGRAWGYAQFIGYGYTSCATCHYNSWGNGPLNDYGRALWASEIAGRVFHTSAVEEETLANQSGFLGSVKLPNFWRPSIGYRGLYYMPNVGSGSTVTPKYITMQADVQNVLRFGEREKLVFVGTVGYIPKPAAAQTSTDPKVTSNWISREHYIRYSLNNSIRVFAGMMDKVYGLRIPDHNAFSREQTRLAQNDQTHGVALAYESEKMQLSLHGFLGNFFEDKDLRQAGASFMADFELAEKFRTGASILTQKNDYLQTDLAGIFTRIGVGKGSAIMAELGIINRKQLSNGASGTGGYGIMQNYLKLARGLHYLTTMEYYTEEIPPKTVSRFLRIAPGIQYFPAQRFEFRLDVMNSRVYDPITTQKDYWDVLSQVHLWF